MYQVPLIRFSSPVVSAPPKICLKSDTLSVEDPLWSF